MEKEIIEKIFIDEVKSPIPVKCDIKFWQYAGSYNHSYGLITIKLLWWKIIIKLN